MADTALHEMVCAFVAGCMDRENYIQFKEFFESGGDLPRAEMGELQNVISLVPVILEIETPDPKLKDQVAKALIGMQDEIKAQIKKHTKAPTDKVVDKTINNHTKANEFVDKEEIEAEKIVEESIKKVTKEKPPQKTIPPTETDAFKKTTYSSKPVVLPVEKELKRKKKEVVEEYNGNDYSNAGIWMAIFSLVLALIVAGYYLYTTAIKLEDDVKQLKEEVTTLKSDIEGTNKFISEHAALIDFFNYKDITSIRLTGSEVYPEGTGKLLVSFEEKDALLQVSNLPSLAANETYQIWLVSKGRSYSLGTFLPTANERYIKVEQLPYLPKEDIELFRITNEPAGGSDLPQGQTFLYGALQENSSKRRR